MNHAQGTHEYNGNLVVMYLRGSLYSDYRVIIGLLYSCSARFGGPIRVPVKRARCLEASQQRSRAKVDVAVAVSYAGVLSTIRA